MEEGDALELVTARSICDCAEPHSTITSSTIAGVGLKVSSRASS